MAQIALLHTSTLHDFKNSSEAREPRFSLNGNHAYEKNT